MIRPSVLESELPHGPWSCRGRDIGDVFEAAARGDVGALRSLLDRDPNLYRAEYWYTQPIHFAVREGQLEAVQVLLDAGADPAVHGLSGESLVTFARDRGHDAVASLLETVAAEATATAGAGPESTDGYSAPGFQPIDLALWTGSFWGVRGDFETARQLIARGAECDLVIAAALGDLDSVRRYLDEDPERIAEARPSGKRALSAAVELGHPEVARFLLERGADPTWSDGATAPRGSALWAAARRGDRELVELLLDHGADPNAGIDSSGSATWAARTPELRALLLARGGRLDPYDLVFLGEDEKALRLVIADPASADAGCGGVLAAACKEGKRELLARLLDAGARVPPVLTECRSYLLEDPEMLRMLLASGMDPDLPNWQRATPLHDLCGRDSRGRPRPHRVECARILLDHGAAMSSRDDDYRSTPLAWAARCDLPDMVELLLERGAPTQLADDEPWATPLAWARRRGHRRVEEILRAAGASL